MVKTDIPSWIKQVYHGQPPKKIRQSFFPKKIITDINNAVMKVAVKFNVAYHF